MSSPGYPMPDDQTQQQQQPLLMPPPGNPALLQLQQALASQMQQQPSGPAYSPWEALNRAVSPLIGVLMQKHAANQQSALEQAAAPEIAAAFKSGDIGSLFNSNNPIVRQMAWARMPDYLKAQIANQAEISKRGVTDKMDIAKDTAEYTGHKTADLNYNQQNIPNVVAQATALVPVEAKKAGAVSDATIANDLAKVRAGQAATYSGQAETARHNRVMEGLGEDKLNVTTGGYKKPWEQ